MTSPWYPRRSGSGCRVVVVVVDRSLAITAGRMQVHPRLRLQFGLAVQVGVMQEIMDEGGWKPMYDKGGGGVALEAA
jgi:hypothetical protein